MSNSKPLYLGETIISDLSDTQFSGFSASEWSFYFIDRYGSIDGEHHKKWVIDQVARILKGTKIIVKLARWSDGQSEYRITLDRPSNEYLAWRESIIDEDEDEDEDYDEGVAP